MTRNGKWLLVLSALFLFACHKNTPAPPPPVASAAPPAAAPAPTITLRATPSSVARGESVTLQWQTTNATSVSIDPGVGTVSTSGNRAVSPTSSVTYSATATGPGGTAGDTARVTVNAPAAGAETSLPPRTDDANATIDQLFQTNVQTIYFEYDKAEISPDQMQRLQGNAAWLKANPNVQFTVEGHCDDRGSEEYNLGLGDRRANAIKNYLVAQGISDSRIKVVSYGAERPVCSENNEDCYKQNRRAAFTLNQ